MTELDDNSIITFGIYKGKKLCNIPAEYLIWIYDNRKCTPDIRNYIESNMDALNKEIIKNSETNHFKK